MSTLFLNPYVSVLELKDKIYIKSNVNIDFPIEKKNAFEYLFSKSKFAVGELSNYFTENEIKELIKAKLLLTNQELVPDVTSMLSRQRGLFSIISSDYRLFEKKVSSLNILIAGAGALGTHILWSLITIGVKNVTILDFDKVEESNLNRQLFYGNEDIGRKKVDVLKNKINRYYPDVLLITIETKITSENYKKLLKGYDIIFKTFDTPVQGTEWVNDICVDEKIPYIAGGFLNGLGIVGPIYIPNITPCHSCGNEYGGVRYNTYSPTFSPIVTMVESKMILIFFKILINHVNDISQYYMFDIFDGEWKEFNNEPKHKCDKCGREAITNNLSQKTLKKYFAITTISTITAFISVTINNYILNYLLLLLLILFKRKEIDNPGFILSYSSILVTINVLTFIIKERLDDIFGNGNLLDIIQNVSFVIVLICILTILVSIFWYSISKLLNTFERKCSDIVNSKSKKRV